MSGTVYLLHFDRPYPAGRKPQHYIGYTTDLATRVSRHRKGYGGKLVNVMRLAGIGFEVARTWAGGPELERRLKGWHKIKDACPLCGVKPRRVR